MNEPAAAGTTRGQSMAAASLSLSLEPLARRRSGQLLVWIVFGAFLALFWAFQVITGMTAGFGFASTKEIVVRRRGTETEAVRGAPPPFRARRLLALMEQDLWALPEEAFLDLWGDPNRWEKQVQERAGR